MAAENIFRDAQSSFGSVKNLVERLVNQTEMFTKDSAIPSCHDIKQKLLRKFFTVRLHIYARKQHNIRKSEAEKSRSGGELGSKSMTMRLAAKKYK